MRSARTRAIPPRAISVMPTRRSTAGATASGNCQPVSASAPPTSRITLAWPTPHRAPIDTARRQWGRRLTSTPIAAKWSGANECAAPRTRAVSKSKGAEGARGAEGAEGDDYAGSNSSATSIAGAECVSAPIEIQSTPVIAMVRTESRVTFPEASTTARPLTS